jgi:soluble lytic murein transglycosylase-like protein
VIEISRRRLGGLAALAAAAGVAALGLLDRGDQSSHLARASLPSNPGELSAQISANDVALREAIDAWRAAGDPPSDPPPPEVIAPARHLQETARYLAAHPNLANATIRLVPPPLSPQIRELTRAARDLRKLSAGWPNRKLKTNTPNSLAELLGYYRAAKKRYGIAPHYLAAIHHVESKFGKVKSNSVAGAQGPMQFIPSTWRIYGRGGNIRDDHDAILAAANLLRHSGAPRSYGRALYAYNPSGLYVDAVSRYARLIAGDPYALYFLYSWEP